MNESGTTGNVKDDGCMQYIVADGRARTAGHGQFWLILMNFSDTGNKSTLFAGDIRVKVCNNAVLFYQ